MKYVERWQDRKWGQVDYFPTQGFTEHGVFGEYGEYLHGIGHGENEWYCDNADTAKHTLFKCAKWAVITQINEGELMMPSEKLWNVTTEMLKTIMENKRMSERIMRMPVSF
ncbi:hypothetical protein JTB14_000213 [Gonioctena quinquepunctata]|nr:hypothetical protein JTB14_000213 [Gonioctena quinquepunctata]